MTVASATKENLKAAFAGESQANRMYTAFAKKAEAEGWRQVAKLFRAAAAAETVHALAHFRVMGGVKTTADNLAAAIAGEGHEFKEMYPAFVGAAEAEGDKAALSSFRYAMAVEETHFTMYTAALAAVQGGQDLPASDIYVCEVCGHTHAGDEAPETCPVCGARRERFTRID